MRAPIVSKCSSKCVLCKCQQEMRRCLPESIMHNPVTSDQTLCPKMAHVCNLFIIHIYTLKISECPLCQTAGYNVSGTDKDNVLTKVRTFCPARSAGFFNPLTRKIVFVRPASVRASVPYFLIVILQLFTSYLEIDEIVAFPIRSALQVCGPLLI